VIICDLPVELMDYLIRGSVMNRDEKGIASLMAVHALNRFFLIYPTVLSFTGGQLTT
jgi:hypothetical protein